MFKPNLALVPLAVSAALFSANSLSQESGAHNKDTFETIVVSGTRTEKHLKDVAGSISVITSDDIEKQVIDDMNQLFKYDPSVQVTGSIGSAQNFIVRGMGGDRILMIKDGMRMNEGYGANGLNDIVGRGFIDTDTLKQVEVAKGASSSLYGSDALGGIVVFTTKDASDYLSSDEKFGANVRVGMNNDGDQTNIATTFAYQADKFEHVLNMVLRDGEEQQNYDESKPQLDIGSKSFFYKGKYNINNTDYLVLSADFWQQDVEGDIADGLLGNFRGLEGYDIIAESNDSEKTNRSFQIQYHSESATQFYDQLNLSLYNNFTQQKDSEYGQIDIDANFGYPLIEIRDMWKNSDYQQDTFGFLSNASLKVNDQHTLGYGLDIEKSESLRTEFKLYSVEGVPKGGYPQSSEKFPETEVQRAGVYINDEMSFMDGDLIVTPGIRYDSYKMDPINTTSETGNNYKSYDENNLSFNIGSLYYVSDALSVFAQYGQGFKVPAYDLAYIDHDNSIYGYKVVPAEDDLSPEKSDSFEIGLRGHVGDFIINGAVFYDQFEDFLATQLIDVETSINPYSGKETEVLVYQYQNIDAVTIKGIELGINYLVSDRTTLFVNGSYQDGKDDNSGEYIQSISPLSGNAGINFDGNNWSTELIANWAQSMKKVNDGESEVAGYVSLDWLVNYQINDQLGINVGVNNVLDKEYVRYSNIAGHKGTGDKSYFAEPGRTLSAKMRFKF
ncbi:TonB-dependent hemoglobin/transferrin/lactoferrin family receptor [Pseudoalteromonas sp. C2R02]|uniref:TonB-dependent hemoglobin/transferrin/lactoferrin family receptor n=1 Tax=Pseudoalteromonas sp. C2R02 TaxID=2841565 RepID=UPI001C07F4C9|nr:TonB-dependent hemoglobin/transferrin/lactoferrin family receptor [Pseudoalteromonas sp. C2R02]MBU2970464.1 TonB-dependent hemoglobin/transferrin/lactoferrin family receptor [Pseudoalteromonas sp. C2R02]